MNGRNLRTVDQCRLPVQIRILRPLLCLIFNCLSDTLFHLCRCCLGKCHDQQPVYIHRILFSGEHGNDSFHQHRCFSGSSCRRHQNITPAKLYDLPLFFGPLDSHGVSSFLLKASDAFPVSPDTALCIFATASSRVSFFLSRYS